MGSITTHPLVGFIGLKDHEVAAVNSAVLYLNTQKSSNNVGNVLVTDCGRIPWTV